MKFTLLTTFLFFHSSKGFTNRVIVPQERCLQSAPIAAEPKTGSYETTDSSSKGFVSSLTNAVNFFMGQEEQVGKDASLSPPPKTPQELMQFIKEDYTENNYLWTGNIYLPAFENECIFTDPTLSFTGTQQFVSNVKNLVPIVDFLTQKTGSQNIALEPRSDLLDIFINEEKGYVQTRWNMVGDLRALPWNPAIDVIGRTKFWYRPTESNDGYRVYYYDEEWEIEAGLALLQLITPKGRIPNTNVVKKQYFEGTSSMKSNKKIFLLNDDKLVLTI